MARDPRAFVSRRIGRPPKKHAPRSAPLPWLCCGPMSPHTIDRRSTAPTPRQVGGTGFERSRLPRSSPMACGRRAFCPVEYRPTAHGARAAKCGFGVVVLWANTRRAPPHPIGRGSTTPTPRQLRGTGFECHSQHVRVPCGPRARALYAPWSIGQLPTKHAPHSTDLAWLCCGPTRSALFAKPPAEAQLHQHRDRSPARASNGLTYRVPLPWRAIRAILCRRYSVDRPKARAAQCALGMVVLWADVGHGSPHAIDRRSTAPTPRQVGGTGFGGYRSPRSSPMARGPRAFCPVEYRPTAHGARAAQCGLGVVVLWTNARRAPPRTISRGSTTQTSRQFGGTGFGMSLSARWSSVWPARFTSHGVSADCPRSTRRAVRTWRGWVVTQREARSSPSRRPRLYCTNTATGRRHGRRTFVTTAFGTHGTRPARSPPRGVSANRPRSTRHAVRTWRGGAVAHREARSSPSRRLRLDFTNTATGQQRELRRS